uniref:CRIB domain-containing protein n=1 Tax=Kalanchoe fedtschenkoi TaxID=63787 RepID=A0A7N0TBZ8_KALFE
MATKMKGLLKGLRYISQIFDEEKEQEMQIGFPTDVKHVAHIGWDGPAMNSPSWIIEALLRKRGHILRGLLQKGEILEKKPLRKRIKRTTPRISPGDLPDIPKKFRRKKSKDSSQGGSSKPSSRTAKAIAEASSYTSPFSDPASASLSQSRNWDLFSCPSPNMQPSDEANDRNKLYGFS